MYNQGYRPPQQPPRAPVPPQQPYNPQGNWYAPPPQQQQPRTARPSGKGGRPPKKPKSFGWQLVKVLLVLIVLAGAGAGLYIWKTKIDVQPYMSVFLPNVSVDCIDLSGKTWA